MTPGTHSLMKTWNQMLLFAIMQYFKLCNILRDILTNTSIGNVQKYMDAMRTNGMSVDGQKRRPGHAKLKSPFLCVHLHESTVETHHPRQHPGEFTLHLLQYNHIFNAGLTIYQISLIIFTAVEVSGNTIG